MPVLSEEEYASNYLKKGEVVYSFYYPPSVGEDDFIWHISRENRLFFFDRNIRNIITMNSVDLYDKNRISYYRENCNKILELVPYLLDEKSCEILCEYIRTYTERDVYRLKETPSEYKYFYGDEGEKIYRHLRDEVFLNFGASTGDTIFGYVDNDLEAKSIIAFEADEERFRRLSFNLRLLPEKWNTIVKPVCMFVNDSSDIDRIIPNEKITLINADIEGEELNMIRRLSKRIRVDKPVMAVCLYHKKEDIVEIPQAILELNSEYRFILRKYSFCWCNVNRNEELVLYAIPKDRA